MIRPSVVLVCFYIGPSVITSDVLSMKALLPENKSLAVSFSHNVLVLVLFVVSIYTKGKGSLTT